MRRHSVIGALVAAVVGLVVASVPAMGAPGSAAGQAQESLATAARRAARRRSAARRRAARRRAARRRAARRRARRPATACLSRPGQPYRPYLIGGVCRGQTVGGENGTLYIHRAGNGFRVGLHLRALVNGRCDSPGGYSRPWQVGDLMHTSSRVLMPVSGSAFGGTYQSPTGGSISYQGRFTGRDSAVITSYRQVVPQLQTVCTLEASNIRLG